MEAIQLPLILLKIVEKEIGPDLTNEGAEDNIVVIAARMVFGVAVNTGTEVILRALVGSRRGVSAY